MTTPQLISREQAAAVLGGVSTRTVDRMRASGQLETQHVRGRAMVTVSSLERYLGLSAGSEKRAKPAKGGDDWDGFEIPGLDDEPEEEEKAA